MPGYLHNVVNKILQLPVVSSESSFKKQCLYFLLLINYQVSKAELFVKKNKHENRDILTILAVSGTGSYGPVNGSPVMKG